MMSPQIDLLATALCALQSELTDVEKNAENPFFKSGYADLSAVWNAVRPLLAKHGLSVSQVGSIMSVDGKFTPAIKTILMHKSGQWLEGSLSLISKDNTMQGLGSAWSYGRRYGLSAILGVTQSDDDANDASKPTEKRMPSTPVAPYPSDEQFIQNDQDFRAAAVDPGNHTVTFGKHKGRAIRDFTLMEFESYATYLLESANKDRKPLSKGAQDFVDNGKAYFSNPDSSRMDEQIPF